MKADFLHSDEFRIAEAVLLLAICVNKAFQASYSHQKRQHREEC